MSKPFRSLCLASLTLTLATITACSGEPLCRTGATTDPVTITAVWAEDRSGVGGDVLAQLIQVTDGTAVSVAVAGPASVATPARSGTR